MRSRGKAHLKILFVRLDRIGDLVLSLPADEPFGDADVHWWIPRGLKFITDHARPRRAAREMDRRIGLRAFLNLLMETRRMAFDRAVVFHAPWWVGLLLWLARIPIRVGVLSQWHSFLFFNRGVRQKRSRAETSELEYNFRLIETGFRVGDLPRSSLRLEPHVPAGEEVRYLAGFGLEPHRYHVLHPGMGGSARNWPIENYASLAIRLTQSGAKVAVTGTAGDESYLAPLRGLLKSTDKSTEIVWLAGRLPGAELLTVLANALTVTAPSTGVVHLAASTGVRTVGLYSPVRVQKPRRWGPHGANASVLVPDVQCPGELECWGPACDKYDCMPLITVNDVEEQLKAAPDASNH